LNLDLELAPSAVTSFVYMRALVRHNAAMNAYACPRASRSSADTRVRARAVWRARVAKSIDRVSNAQARAPAIACGIDTGAAR
jgi:hypothetical protein